MKPPRQDIALPPLPPDAEWAAGKGPNLARLVARGPLLVHFFDFAQLNSLRALPYVVEWSRRYREHGLNALGVHTPRFPFTRSREAVAAALPGLGIEWPVAIDSEHRMWRDYGVHGWPSLFLWSRGGALRWYHLGEGDYEATEAAIREALEEADANAPGREAEEVAGKPEWPPLMEPLRPSDAEGATVIAPSPELLPGGSLETPWTPTGEQPALRVPYEAGGAYVAAAGAGAIAVRLDGVEREPVQITEPGCLGEIVVHEGHERHELELEPEPGSGVEIFSIQFSPAAA